MVERSLCNPVDGRRSHSQRHVKCNKRGGAFESRRRREEGICQENSVVVVNVLNSGGPKSDANENMSGMVSTGDVFIRGL